MLRRALLPRSALLLLLGALQAPGARGGEPLPCTAAIQVLQGSRRVPDSFLAEVTRQIREQIESRDCVRGLVGEDAAPGIVLRVILDDASEETSHALSIADRSQAQDARASLDYVSTFEVRWQAEISVPETGAVARSKTSRAKTERRPAFLGEDTAAAARQDAARNIGRQARAYLCGGAGRKLLREQSRTPAREDTPSDSR